MSEETIEQSSRHSIYVQRYAGGLSNDYDPYQTNIINIVNSFLLASYDLDFRQFTSRLNNMQRQVELEYSSYFDYVTNDLQEFSASESEWQLEQTAIATEEEQEGLTPIILSGIWGAVLATPMVFESSNTVITLNELFDSRVASQSKAIRDSINTSKVTNQTLKQAQVAVTGKGGILSGKDKSKNRTTVSTGTRHVAVNSRAEVAKKGEAIGYQWISVIDSRTSTICRSLSEKLFYFTDKYNPYPPAHPNCRSDVDFIYSRSDPIAKRETYYEFLKKQSVEFQDDVLGPTRGKLFRNGGLTPEQFSALNVDQLFRPITLQEMKEKNPTAFKKAKIDDP